MINCKKTIDKFSLYIMILLLLTGCQYLLANQIIIQQGFLNQLMRDLFSLIGGILSLEKIYKFFKKSTTSGKLFSIYTQHILPWLLQRAYKLENRTEIDNLLEDLAIGKLNSNIKESQENGIMQLGVLKPTKKSYEVLARALLNDDYCELRPLILKSLEMQYKYNEK